MANKILENIKIANSEDNFVIKDANAVTLTSLTDILTEINNKLDNISERLVNVEYELFENSDGSSDEKN